MGAVYRAYDERLGRDVAVKVLKNPGEPGAIDRFVREARAASALNHPNIVTVFDVGESERGFFIAMELVRGRGLRSLIGQPLDPKRLSSLVRQTAEALGVAHQAGIVHRDIKPENLMVRDDGYVKVLDFGLARLTKPLTSTIQTMAPTTPHSILGTIKYMSPEQTVEQSVGPPSDVFSLGVVMYELATGRHPFDADSLYGVQHAIVAHQPVPPARLNAEVTGHLEGLILQMLDKDASRRPTAADVAAALDDATAGTYVRAQPDAGAPKRHSVGRARPRSDLHAALDQVRRGHGLIVGVSGEPGIGKSTLVDDFLIDLAESGAPAVVGRGLCSERLAGTEAYLPLLDALSDLLRADDGALARLMRTVAPLWYGQVAPADSRAASLEGARPAQTGAQERLKRELVAFLTEVGRQQPIVLFFDDVHWVDVSTVDLLAYLARQFDALPVLVIATYRREELQVLKHPLLSAMQDLQSRGLFREIALEFLTRDDVGQYIALRFPGHRLPEGFADLIFAKTEGNPLFVADVLGYLAEQRVISQDGDGWILTRSMPDIARELPESVRGMILRKIDALGDDSRRVLMTASVQGYEFDGAILASILRLDLADVEDQLDRIERVHEFVKRIREHEYPDGTLTLRYRFVHLLYQNVLYGSLTPARKVALSRAIGKALETVYRDRTTDIASELAVLYEAAREFTAATDYFLMAAQRAAAMFAYEEALALGRRALAALRVLPDGADRRRRELTILMSIGVAATATRGYSSQDVQDIYDRASALCVEFQEVDQLALALWRLFAFAITRLRLETAQQIANRFGQLVGHTGTGTLAIQSALAQGLVANYRGEFRSAVGHFERAAAASSMAARHTMSVTLGTDPAVSSNVYIASTRWCLGYADRAVQAIDAALAATLEIAHPYTEAHALHFSSMIRGWRGEWDQLLVYNQRALAVTARERFSYYAATACFFEGMWLAHTGRPHDGLARMREGWLGLRGIGGRVSLQRFATDFAEQLGLAGEVGEGLDVLAGEIAAMATDRGWESELFRMKGELLLMRGDLRDADEAHGCFRHAIDVASQQGAKSLELRSATSMARLLRGQGKTREAAAQLSDAYGWFTEGFDTADLVTARELLAAIAASTT